MSNSFPAVFAAHEPAKSEGGYHVNHARTMRAILENPAVSRANKAIALKSVRAHLSCERTTGQNFGTTEVFEGFDFETQK